MSDNKISMCEPKRRGFGKILMMSVVSTMLLGGCSTFKSNTIVDGGIEINDPFEEQNRMVMSFNQAVDKNVIFPVLEGYRTVTPKPARTGLRNFLRNLSNPIIFINQVLQGDAEGAGNVLMRTAINSTIGFGGLIDIAGHEGIEYEQEDFGQTLAVWGVDHGPYMVVPFIGPSSMRDYGGYLTDSVIDPVRWYAYGQDKENLYTAKFALNYLDIRDSLMDTQKELDKSSFDYYAAVRSAYYQYRKSLIADKSADKSVDVQNVEIPDYDDY